MSLGHTAASGQVRQCGTPGWHQLYPICQVGWAKRPWASGIQPPRDTDHVARVVPVGEPGPQEDALHVDVVRDVAPLQVVDGNADLSRQDLHRNCGLLLADAVECSEAAPQSPYWLITRRAARTSQRGIFSTYLFSFGSAWMASRTADSSTAIRAGPR